MNTEKILNAIDQINKIILGKDDKVKEIMTAFLANGHVMLEDIPGVGKTTLAIAFSKSLGLECNRIQFTPDVLPSDLVGFSIYRKDEEKFVYRPGSVFCNLLLAVELITATRDNKYIDKGASPRATIALVKMSKAAAWLDRRSFVTPSDAANQFSYVVRHRIILTSAAVVENISKDEVIQEIIRAIKKPPLGDNSL